MPCKRSDLVKAINAFAAARTANDDVLTNFAGTLVTQLMDSLTYEPEEEEEVKSEIKPELPPIKKPTRTRKSKAKAM